MEKEGEEREKTVLRGRMLLRYIRPAIFTGWGRKK